ncbi:MAG TPA: DUF1015 domain-containing protein [Flavobacteriales bacterium]|nr:DUF1015 domain-containing protein [Flavobacteriales bacterium]
MISLRPFRAWRPVPDKAHLVGSRTYVSYAPEELAERLARNPHSFLHVLRPEDADTAKLTRTERFHRVRVAFKRFCDHGVMLRDETPAILLYEQSAHGNTSRGIIAGVSVKDYTEGRIKVHEQTLTARENLFAEYLGSTGINAEPVLLTTPDGTAWEAMLDPLLGTRPVYDFVTNDRVRHRLWPITDLRMRERLQRAFADIPALYIADGHHRLASSARLAASTKSTEVDAASWCLAFIVPRSQLYIYNFDRAVTTLNGLSESELLERLAAIGKVERVDAPWAAPGIIAIRLKSGWYVFHLPKAEDGLSPAERLDPARLSDLVLGPVLGIQDLRTDERVRFVPGIAGTNELDRMVSEDEAAVAFHLHPVSFTELKAVADSGGTMPPKSTYIEPKLRSGLVVYSLEDV